MRCPSAGLLVAHLYNIPPLNTINIIGSLPDVSVGIVVPPPSITIIRSCWQPDMTPGCLIYNLLSPFFAILSDIFAIILIGPIDNLPIPISLTHRMPPVGTVCRRIDGQNRYCGKSKNRTEQFPSFHSLVLSRFKVLVQGA